MALFVDTAVVTFCILEEFALLIILLLFVFIFVGTKCTSGKLILLILFLVFILLTVFTLRSIFLVQVKLFGCLFVFLADSPVFLECEPKYFSFDVHIQMDAHVKVVSEPLVKLLLEEAEAQDYEQRDD